MRGFSSAPSPRQLHVRCCTVGSTTAGAPQLHAPVPAAGAGELHAPLMMTRSIPSPDSLRLLVADRRGWLARTMASVLEPTGWTVVHARDGSEARDQVRRLEPHVILLDEGMADVDAVELCRQLRADPRVGVLTPILVLATTPLHEQRLATLRAGATDYVPFPSDSEVFLLRLRALALARREVERIQRSTLLDAETGLYSASGLEHRAGEIANDATRRQEPLTCVAFTRAMHGAGRAVDERANTELGNTLRRAGRRSDAIGRLDDVLVVIAPATGEPGARRLAERLHRVLDRASGSMGGASDAASMPRVRAAWCTVPDFSRSKVDVRGMIDRAVRHLDEVDASGAAAIVGEIISTDATRSTDV